MTEIQAVRLPIGDAHRLGRLRSTPGLEVHEEAEWVWLRAREPEEPLRVSLRSLPGTTFRVLADGQLCETGKVVPLGHLPQGPWEKLSRWIELERPPAALSGEMPGRVPLRLVASDQVREPNVLVTSPSEWLEYGSRAPQVRLDRWYFAVSAGGDVLVRGLPLPPLPGLRLVENKGIAVPCGRAWSPEIDADVLVKLFGLAAGDVLLCFDDDRRERVSGEMFVRATRSAIRLSVPQ